MSLIAVGQTLSGLILLVLGGSVLVSCASALARAAGISRLVVGLTVVALGTSAPEMAVTTISALEGRADLAFGNVVGSNLFNVLFVLGASGALAPLAVSRRLLALDVSIMVALSAGVYGLAVSGTVSRVEGLGLLVLLVLYVWMQVRLGRREERQGVHHHDPAPRRHWSLNVLGLGAALGLLLLGSHLLVDGAVAIARALGMSELVIGLTVVSAGTSMPEAATSIMAGLRGQRDIALGNVIGSCIFNIGGVLGLAASLSPGGIPVAPEALAFDVPVMVAAAALCVPLLFTGWRLARLEGWLLLGLYGAYTTFLVLKAEQHAALPAYGRALGWVVLPLAGLGVLASLVRSLRRREWRSGATRTSGTPRP